jgi:hypothetical protein
MGSSEDDFKDLQRLLALKKHEQPPPGYFYYLPEKIMVRLEQEKERQTLAEHSTWWEWLVARFDARPWLASAYACTISGLLLMGFRVSHLMQADLTEDLARPMARMPDPNNITPAPFFRTISPIPRGWSTSLQAKLFTTSQLRFLPPASSPPLLLLPTDLGALSIAFGR